MIKLSSPLKIAMVVVLIISIIVMLGVPFGYSKNIHVFIALFLIAVISIVSFFAVKK